MTLVTLRALYLYFWGAKKIQTKNIHICFFFNLVYEVRFDQTRAIAAATPIQQWRLRITLQQIGKGFASIETKNNYNKKWTNQRSDSRITKFETQETFFVFVNGKNWVSLRFQSHPKIKHFNKMLQEISIAEYISIGVRYYADEIVRKNKFIYWSSL